jgi:hypothetical protein
MTERGLPLLWVPEPTVTGQSLFASRPDAFSSESADTVGQPLRALAVPRARVVISFDIDGTMEFGDPPGPVSASIARELVDRGCILGVASDWALSCQRPEWARHGIAPRFVGGKHHLPAVKSRFTADRYVHVGDTAVDEHYARLAGFTFLHVDQLPNPLSADAIHFA